MRSLSLWVFYDGLVDFAEKTFVDSSFYSDRNELYPTFEEQVKLCQDISSSLTSSENRQSLGARMFTRRKQNAKKWVANGRSCRMENLGGQQTKRARSLSQVAHASGLLQLKRAPLEVNVLQCTKCIPTSAIF